MKCEKCGQESWSPEMIKTQVLRLLGGHLAELCLPCQRAWNRLATESPEFLELKRQEFLRELLLAQAHGRDLKMSEKAHDDVVQRIMWSERHFLAVFDIWLAETPTGGEK